MDRLAVVGTVTLFLVSVSFLSFFVFSVDPRYLNFSGFLVFYLALFCAAWSAGYMLVRWSMRNRRGSVPGIARRTALVALCIAGGVLLGQLRWLSVYTALGLIAAAGGIEYYYSKKR